MFIVPVTRESRQLSRLFDDTLERFFGPVVATENSGTRSPALDVAESDRTYTVKLEMPGVTKEDVKRMAQKYMRPDNLLIVVVGDRASNEAALRKLAEVERRDLDGNLVEPGK